MLLTACTDSVDPRDKFIGVYDFETSGDVDVYVSVMKVATIPINIDGTFTISKEGAKDRVNIVWNNDTVHGVVSGDKMHVETVTVDTVFNDFTAQISLYSGQAQLDSTQLRWTTDVYARLQYSTYAGAGEGKVTIIANKK